MKLLYETEEKVLGTREDVKEFLKEKGLIDKNGQVIDDG